MSFVDAPPGEEYEQGSPPDYAPPPGHSPGHSQVGPPGSSNGPPGPGPGPGRSVMPHSAAAEESILGAMMLSADAVGTALELLTAEHFYSPANGHVFDAIAGLHGGGEPVDSVTVAEELARHKVLDQAGGEERLRMLQASTPMTKHAARYARIVEENALLRRLIAVSHDIAELGYSTPNDVTRALDEAEAMVYAVAEHRIVSSTSHLKGLLEEALTRLDEIFKNGDGLAGISTGFTALDDLLSGLQHSTLNVVGARPSMGKTAFALTIASHVAVTVGKPVLFFSLEMSHLELTNRLLAADARIDSRKLQTGGLQDGDWDRITNSIERLGAAKLWIDDNPNTTVPEVRAKSRRLSRQAGELGLVVVDYLQLMSGRLNSETRQVEVAEMSRGLKVLARELQTPVLACSQLSRNLEARADKRPMLSDLRESGSIEQDADVVMFLYRDEVYNEDSADKGLAEVIVAKHRNGPTGKAALSFLPKHACFANTPDTSTQY